MVVRHPQTPVYSCGEPQYVVDGSPHRPRCDPRAGERWMAQRHSSPAQQVQVAERVTFLDGHRTVAGYVARKGRTYAHVVTDEGTEVRVPYRLLTRDVGTPRKPVQSRTDILRAQWQAGDRVSFAVGPEVLHGTISRVNPRYTHVVCDDDREYRVPYARLLPQEPHGDTAPRPRPAGELQAM